MLIAALAVLAIIIGLIVFSLFTVKQRDDAREEALSYKYDLESLQKTHYQAVETVQRKIDAEVIKRVEERLDDEEPDKQEE
jgi:type II secretory pathway pseudopilin PulG